VAAAPHRLVDGDPATLIVHGRNRTGDSARDDARREHDGAGVDGFVGEVHAPGVDRSDGCRHSDVGAAPLEHAGGHGRQLHVDLWQDAWACLEQPEANLITTDAWIEAQHVVSERSNLPEQASNRSGVSTKKFSRLTRVISTSVCERASRSR
jgi:hypothetical protein